MAPELDDSTWPPRYKGAFFKQPRGTATLKKEKASREESAEELDIKKLVRLRDGKCRWPEAHKCRGGMEVVHLKDRSLGGEYVTGNLWLACKWIHRSGPKSIHSKDLALEPLTKKGCDGPMRFYRQTFEVATGKPKRTLVARESAIGVVEK
jgi:hypothetical protein